MAYIGTVDYDDSGTIRTLDGMGAVTYDNGARRNLSGQPLGAVKYDDGGRFRSLVGMGQADVPTMDLPLAPPQDVIPLSWNPPDPAGIGPVVDTTSISVPGTLVDTSPPFITTGLAPAYNPDTTSIPVPGDLTPPAAVAPSSAGTLVSAVAPTAGVLTSILNAFKGVTGPTTTTAIKPTTPTAGTSWFTQSSVMAGLPNWGLLAGVSVAGIVAMKLMGGSSSGSPRRKNPIRRNPMELVLMGANPRRRRSR